MTNEIFTVISCNALVEPKRVLICVEEFSAFCVRSEKSFRYFTASVLEHLEDLDLVIAQKPTNIFWAKQDELFSNS